MTEVGAVATQETSQYIECTCKIQWYAIFMLGLSILGLKTFVIIKLKKLKLFRGHLFSNTVKIMLFISDTKYYVPIKLCKAKGSIHLFKISGTITSQTVQLKRNKNLGCVRNRLEGSQHDFKWKYICLPQLFTIKLETNSKLVSCQKTF